MSHNAKERFQKRAEEYRSLLNRTVPRLPEEERDYFRVVSMLYDSLASHVHPDVLLDDNDLLVLDGIALCAAKRAQTNNEYLAPFVYAITDYIHEKCHVLLPACLAGATDDYSEDCGKQTVEDPKAP